MYTNIERSRSEPAPTFMQLGYEMITMAVGVQNVSKGETFNQPPPPVGITANFRFSKPVDKSDFVSVY